MALCLLGPTLVGCQDRVRRPSPEELARFQESDPARGAQGDEGPWGAPGPSIDMDRVLQAMIATGPYRAVGGDVLRLEMPRFLEQQVVQPGVDTRQTYNCRIGDDGTIVLPIIGSLAVRGKSLAEIESAIAAQYYPKYVAAPLPVYVSVLEYQTQRVSVVGAVAVPGIHSLRHDQMSLVALLMQAGGIAGKGAAVIRITRADAANPDTRQVDIPARFEGQGGRRPGRQLQVVFEREGPLRTTGWLRVEEENGRVSVRQWLDVGNEPQRRQFLRALASPAEWPATEDLGRRLTRLGAYLESLPEARPAKPEGGTSEIRIAKLETGPGPARAFGALDSGFVSGPARAGLSFPRPAGIGFQISDSPPPQDWRALDHGRFVTASRFAQDRSSVSRTVVAKAPGQDADRADLASRNLLRTRGIEGNDGNAVPVRGAETLVLPVRGLNIPFADVVVEEGDTVVVEPPREQSIAIVGLVGRPGNMPYPPDAHYTLIQAIAFAGGLDLVADPRYVSVYRLAPDGEVVSTTFQLVNPRREQQLTETLTLPLKPGDVVSVEHTPRTRTKVFFDRVFRITLGLYIDPRRLWND